MTLINSFFNRIKIILFTTLIPFFYTFGGAFGFESGLSSWTQSSYDDFNWSIGPPIWGHSSNTGPLNAAEGNNYLYVESSSPNNPNKSAILENTFDLSSAPPEIITFKYNMNGIHTGSLFFEVFDEEWVSLLSLSGELTQESSWKTALIDLSAYNGISSLPVRFRAITGSGARGDISIDDVILDTSSDSDLDGMADSFEYNIIDYSNSDLISSINDVLPSDDFDGDLLSNFAEYVLSKDPTDSSDGSANIQDGITILKKIADIQPSRPIDGNTTIYVPLNEDAKKIFEKIIQNEEDFSEDFLNEYTQSDDLIPLTSVISAEALFYRSLCEIYSILEYDLNALLSIFVSSGSGSHYSFDENFNVIDDTINHFMGYLEGNPFNPMLKNITTNFLPQIESSINMLESIGNTLESLNVSILISPASLPIDSSIYFDQADAKFITGALSLLKSSFHHLLALKLEIDLDKIHQNQPAIEKTITVDGDSSDWFDINTVMLGTSEIGRSNAAEEDFLLQAKYAVDNSHLYFLIETPEDLMSVSFFHKGSYSNGLTNLYLTASKNNTNNTWATSLMIEGKDYDNDNQLGNTIAGMSPTIVSNGLIFEGSISLNALPSELLGSYSATNFALTYLSYSYTDIWIDRWWNGYEYQSYTNTWNELGGNFASGDLIAEGVFDLPEDIMIYNSQWGYWDYFEIRNAEILSSHPNIFPFGNHTILRDFVTNELSLAKSELMNAIDLILDGYDLASSRPYSPNMHFIEIDPADFSDGSDGEQIIADINMLGETLKTPILISPENGFNIEVTDNFVGGQYYNDDGWLRERIYLGALYEPNYFTLDSILPEFYNTILEPLADTITPPTLGGLLPDMTQQRLDTALQIGIMNDDISVDIDDDGMPDSFEISRFNHPSLAEPHMDYDDDGLSSLSEYHLGTHPLNDASAYNISLTPSGGSLSKSQITIEPGTYIKSDLIFDVQWCSSIGNKPVVVGSYDASLNSTFELPYQHGFYRICIFGKHIDDIDGDGIINRIEESIGGNMLSTSYEHLLLDNDSDGANNLTEALFQTNPYDSNSYFYFFIDTAGYLSWGIADQFGENNTEQSIEINIYDHLSGSFSNILSSTTEEDIFEIDMINNSHGMFQVSVPEETPYLFVTDWMQASENNP